MIIIDLTIVLNQLKERCNQQGLHSTFLITKSSNLVVRAWRKSANKCTSCFEASEDLYDSKATERLVNTVWEFIEGKLL